MILKSCGTAVKGRKQYFESSVRNMEITTILLAGYVFIDMSLHIKTYFKNKKENKDER